MYPPIIKLVFCEKKRKTLRDYFLCDEEVEAFIRFFKHINGLKGDVKIVDIAKVIRCDVVLLEHLINQLSKAKRIFIYPVVTEFKVNRLMRPAKPNTIKKHDGRDVRSTRR